MVGDVVSAEEIKVTTEVFLQRRSGRQYERWMSARCCDNVRPRRTLMQGEYYLWHRHLQKNGAFLCPKCYAYDYYPRKYKTKEEARARHKEWALQNPEHMRINSIKGCVAAQKYGKNGKPEKELKKALEHLGIDFIGNHPFKYGE